MPPVISHAWQAIADLPLPPPAPTPAQQVEKGAQIAAEITAQAQQTAIQQQTLARRRRRRSSLLATGGMGDSIIDLPFTLPQAKPGKPTLGA